MWKNFICWLILFVLNFRFMYVWIGILCVNFIMIILKEGRFDSLSLEDFMENVFCVKCDLVLCFVKD